MIISSLLDNDFYKFTMMQAVFHNFATVNAEYVFVCRNHAYDTELPQIAPALRAEANALAELRLTDEEFKYLAGLNAFTPDFLAFLKTCRLNPEFVKIGTDGGRLSLRVAGPWLHTILFEVPLLAMVNELFYTGRFPAVSRDTLPPLAELDATGVRFSDFGTRRRVSFAHQRRVLSAVKGFKGFSGTSNVLFAMNMNVPPVGTMAHEYLEAGQAIYGPRQGQREMLKLWLKEHGGKFTIALTDVIDTAAFLTDFDAKLTRSYAGVRHDSGDPVRWGEQMLAHYRALGIDPKTKSLVFSDMVTPAKAAVITAAFREQTNLVFGIGSWLDNNIGLPRLNSVIKMVGCGGKPVAKITNTPEKTITPDDEYLRALRAAYAAPRPG